MMKSSTTRLLALQGQIASHATAAATDPKDTSDFTYVDYSRSATGGPVFTADHKSLMARTLQGEEGLWDKMKGLRTAKGYTFSNAIQTGVETPHLGVGATAGDEEVRRQGTAFSSSSSSSRQGVGSRGVCLRRKATTVHPFLSTPSC